MGGPAAPRENAEFDRDVVIVGGGPTGSTAGVFTARYGLDTVIFDRGRSSIQRCAYLENFPGFPAGIDIETLYELLHDHAAEAGCAVVSDLVESVEREDGGFAVETQDGRRVTARRVVAATRYGGEYLRGFGDEAMFETYEYDGEERHRFDRSYPEHDGTTPIEGLYVASPSRAADRQAIIAAGRGARVAITLVEEARGDRGYPEPLTDRYDWVRRESALDDEWSDRDRWREHFRDRLPDGHGRSEERLAELCEHEIDRRLATYIPADERERRAERGQRRLVAHIDDDIVLEAARELEADRRSSGGD